MHCTEMAGDLSESFIIDYALQSDGETALSRLGRCDLAGVLTSYYKNVELLDVLAVKKG